MEDEHGRDLIADGLGDQGMRVDVLLDSCEPCSRRNAESYMTWSSVT